MAKPSARRCSRHGRGLSTFLPLGSPACIAGLSFRAGYALVGIKGGQALAEDLKKTREGYAVAVAQMEAGPMDSVAAVRASLQAPLLDQVVISVDANKPVCDATVPVPPVTGNICSCGSLLRCAVIQHLVRLRFAGQSEPGCRPFASSPVNPCPTFEPAQDAATTFMKRHRQQNACKEAGAFPETFALRSAFARACATNLRQQPRIVMTGSSNTLLEFGNLINFLAPDEYHVQREGEMIGASAVADVVIENGKVSLQQQKSRQQRAVPVLVTFRL